ncbi:MAG: hypothetical protein ACTJGR_05330 [Pauljensenia sp.]
MGMLTGLVGDVPGQPSGVFALQGSVETARATVSTTEAGISNAPRVASTWKGLARDAFDTGVDRGVKQSQRLTDGLDDGATSLETYAWQLQTLQDRAATLRGRMETLDAQLESAPTTERFTALVTLLPLANDILRDYSLSVQDAKGAAVICAAELRAALHLEAVNLNESSENIGTLSPLDGRAIERITNELDHLDHANVNQGQIGDCYFLASLMAVMQSPEGRAWLKSCVEIHLDRNGRPDGFLVTIHEDPLHPDDDTARTTLVTSVYANGVRGADGASVASIFEAAYGQTHPGGTRSSQEGGFSGGYIDRAIQELTGVRPDVEKRSSGWNIFGWGDGYDDGQRDRIEQAIKDGRPVTTETGTTRGAFDENGAAVVQATTNGTTQGLKLSGSHAYMVVSANDDGITLRNPWGYNKPAQGSMPLDGTFTISWDDFETYYGSVSMGGDYR